ncbi:Lmo0850 family protein [Peribacillus tepidiphilus]|jgi:hypothetical protein|uniref:Lmo0850 family protein n=1 Tax=Peribacillus tepidiphilus TaxID=2652445 RepID=UPI0035B51EBA
MITDLIQKFQKKGIKIEKTKSRHEVFFNVLMADPSLASWSGRNNSLTPKQIYHNKPNEVEFD